MIELLLIYKWSVLCGMTMAAALALLGAHLAARDRALQSLALSQGASLGVLLGLALAGAVAGHGGETEHGIAHALPLASGFAVALAVYLASERAAMNRRSSKGTVFVTIFIGLLAACYWAISYLPGLESHLAQAFFGDLVTIGGLELWFALAAAALGIAWLTLDSRALTRDSFDVAILGEEALQNRAPLRRFQWGALALTSVAIFSLGMLFTVAMLFVGTTFLRGGRGGVKAHFCKIALVSSAGTALGFLASLRWEKFSTVPTIVLTTVALATLYAAIEHLGRKRGA